MTFQSRASALSQLKTKLEKLKHFLLWYKERLTLYLYSEDQAPAAVSAVATTSPGPAKP